LPDSDASVAIIGGLALAATGNDRGASDPRDEDGTPDHGHGVEGSANRVTSPEDAMKPRIACTQVTCTW